MYDFVDAAGMGDFGMIGNLAAQSVRSGWRSALGGSVSGLVLTACLAPAAGAQTCRETVFNCHDSGSGALYLPATLTQVNPPGPNLTTDFRWEAVGNLITVNDPERRRARET